VLVIGDVFHEHGKRQILLEALPISRDSVCRLKELDAFHGSAELISVFAVKVAGIRPASRASVPDAPVNHVVTWVTILTAIA
jgi:hypothetical protein